VRGGSRRRPRRSAGCKHGRRGKHDSLWAAKMVQMMALVLLLQIVVAARVVVVAARMVVVAAQWRLYAL
jgi:hypothetical protein